MRTSTLTLLFVACAAIGIAPAPSSGSPAGPPQAVQKPTPSEQPRFRASTDLVVVDVSAISRDGTPVRDLQPEDFTVRIDGGTDRVDEVHRSVDWGNSGRSHARAARAGVLVE
jgi:hypothetical protein